MHLTVTLPNKLILNHLPFNMTLTYHIGKVHPTWHWRHYWIQWLT